MTHRLLLASLLLFVGANADAAMERFHSASGDTSAPCPTSEVVEPADLGVVKSDVSTPAANPPATPATTRPAAASTSVRPTLRWHSFLPGMMK